mmetsp:Transcript_17515/g.45098  ORF Transcript_17515/g.45098 Transcript_17515/m.45098 type:complete len:234 (-) Transcript_17515:85-786(-)
MDRLGAQLTCILGCSGAALSTYSLVFMSGTKWVPYAYGICMIGIYGSMVGLGFMQLVRKFCPKPLLGTMMGLQGSMNGVAGAIAPPLGGAIYDLQAFTPYILTSVCIGLTSILYATLPPAPGVDEVPMVEKILSRTRRAPLRRSATFGMPIYNDKSFALQVAVNKMRLDLDPELNTLYEQYRSLIDAQKGAEGGLKSVATVPGDMVQAQVAVSTERDRSHENFGMSRADTMHF